MDCLEERMVSVIGQINRLATRIEAGVKTMEKAKEELVRGVVRGVALEGAVLCLEDEIARRTRVVHQVLHLKREGLKDIYAAIYEGLDEIAQRTSQVLPVGLSWANGSSSSCDEELEEDDEEVLEKALRKQAYVGLFGGLTDGSNNPCTGGHYLRYPDLPKGGRSEWETQELFSYYTKARKLEDDKLATLDTIMDRLEASAEAGFPLCKSIQTLASQRITLAKKAKETDENLLGSLESLFSRLICRMEAWTDDVLEEDSYKSISDLLDY